MRVLVLDDDYTWVRKIASRLERQGHSAVEAFSWSQGWKLLEERSVGALILDLHLGGDIQDGMQLLEMLQVDSLGVPTMVVSLSVDLRGVTGQCFSYPFVRTVIPKKRFAEFTCPFQEFLRFLAASQEGHRMSSESRVFVVHGRNETARNRVVGILDELRVDPVYLDREPSAGRTIIELVEEYSEAKYAVVVMSGDDVGALAGEADALTPRARQNVVFEAGYLMARLGRKRIMLLRDDGLETPSDLDGIRYELLGARRQDIKTALMRDFYELGIPHQP